MSSISGQFFLSKGSKKTLLRKIHQKFVAQLKKMGLTEFNELRPFLVTAPVLANMYIEKKNVSRQK